VTIQVRPAQGRDLERDVRTVVETVRGTPGILDVRAFTDQESGKLLEPWLGTGLSLNDLPVPRVIVARITPGETTDLVGRTQRLPQRRQSATRADRPRS